MRIRTIKPAFWTSLSVAALCPEARLTFIGLWNYADDAGREVDEPRLLKGALWALDDRVTSRKVDGWLDDIAGQGLIERYRVGARRYYAIVNWPEHQRVDKPRPSTIPPPPIPDHSVILPGSVVEDSRLEGKGREEEGKRKGTDIAPTRRRDELFEVVAEVCGIDWHDLTGKSRASLNAAVADIRPLDPDPEDVRFRAANWPYSVPLTPHALAKHWPQLRNAHIVKRGKSVDNIIALADKAEGQ